MAFNKPLRQETSHNRDAVEVNDDNATDTMKLAAPLHDAPSQRNATWLDTNAKETPLWMRTFYASLPVCAVCVLHGSIHDLQPLAAGTGGRIRHETTQAALWAILRTAGFDALLRFDPMRGLSVAYRAETITDREITNYLSAKINKPVVGDLMQTASDRAEAQRNNPYAQGTNYENVDLVVEAIATSGKDSPALALCVDYSSQMRDNAGMPDSSFQKLLLTCLAIANAHASYDGAQVRFKHETYGQMGESALLRHPVIWMVDKMDDLPIWLTRGDGIRTIALPLPDVDTRSRMADTLVRKEVRADADEEAIQKISARFADATEGFSLRGMYEAVRLSKAGGGSFADHIEESVRTYAQGLTENPWQSQRLKESLAQGEAILKRRVLGQDAAVERVLDILKRSALGLTGAHSKKPASQPRGVLYFAGATGVGKTEMAKAIAELVFADEAALVRFDMSEFKDDNAKVRLVGAPPSYVGYGSGGELTNAVQQRPHSIVLFDEMDKAGSDVNDLFLQILSDGRLTDGSGRTASFSECLIIFTSNQGVAAIPELKDLDMDISEDVDRYETTVLRAVKRHFSEGLGRPELLGRLGDNIVVFHPIHGAVARDLADSFIDTILNNVRIRVGNEVSIASTARAELIAKATAPSVLENGGRGITTALEEHLVNPLGRALFELDNRTAVHIARVYEGKDGTATVELRNAREYNAGTRRS